MTGRDVVGGVIILIALTVIMVGFTWSQQEPDSPHIDPETLCPINQAESHTIVLIDRTDPFTRKHHALLRWEIDEVIASLTIGERFSIYTIEATASDIPRYLFSVCIPPKGSDAHWLDGNARITQERYEELFDNPLNAHVTELGEPTQAPRSPIMETIQKLSLLPTFDHSVKKRQIIIVSDLLQNVPPHYTHYRVQRVDYAAFKKSTYGAKTVEARLEGVVVKLVYLPNQKATVYQTAAHQIFWHLWFADIGAIVQKNGYQR